MGFLFNFFGVLIGGLFVLVGAWLAFKWQSKDNRFHQLERIQGVLKALYAELDLSWKNFEEQVEEFWEELEQKVEKRTKISLEEYKQISPEEHKEIVKNQVEEFWKEVGLEKPKFLNLHLAVSPHYLTIYTSNANLIGQIEDPKLVEKIVEVYQSFQGLIEGYKRNNTLIEKYEKSVLEENKKGEKGFLELLAAWAPKIRKAHNKFKKEIESFLPILDREISRLERESQSLEKELSGNLLRVLCSFCRR